MVRDIIHRPCLVLCIHHIVLPATVVEQLGADPTVSNNEVERKPRDDPSEALDKLLLLNLVLGLKEDDAAIVERNEETAAGNGEGIRTEIHQPGLLHRANVEQTDATPRRLAFGCDNASCVGIFNDVPKQAGPNSNIQQDGSR